MAKHIGHGLLAATRPAHHGYIAGTNAHLIGKIARSTAPGGGPTDNQGIGQTVEDQRVSDVGSRTVVEIHLSLTCYEMEQLKVIEAQSSTTPGGTREIAVDHTEVSRPGTAEIATGKARIDRRAELDRRIAVVDGLGTPWC